MPNATPGRPRRSLFVGLLAGILLVAVGAGVARERGEGPEPAPAGGASPSASPSASAPTAPSPPACATGDARAAEVSYGAWDRVLLDTSFRLSSDYVPPDLSPASTAGFSERILVRAFVLSDLAALRAAAAAAGNPVGLVVGYRSFEQQRDLFEQRAGELGEADAADRVARPGHSEHQLGTALDFKSPGAPDVTQAWARSPAGAWMAANAWRYGFVMSYPKGGRPVTCYTYEPWHFRYLGRAEAARLEASGLTLRAYLWARRPGS